MTQKVFGEIHVIRSSVPRAAAAVRGETVGILEKSHKVKKIWKMREHGVKKAKLFHRRID